MALCISNVFDSHYDKQKCANDYINFSGFVLVNGMTSGFKIILLSYICEDLDKYVLLTNTEHPNQFIEYLYIHKLLSQQLNHINCLCGTIYTLWFKFILGVMFFGLGSILFAIVLDYGNEYMTKEHKNRTGFKNFAPKINLNHNIYIFRSQQVQVFLK